MFDEEDAILRCVKSSRLDMRVQIKMGVLEGIEKGQQRQSFEKLVDNPSLRFSGLYSEDFAPFQIKLQVFDNGQEICLPVITSAKAFENRWEWNEWVRLPLLYSDLSRHAVLALTIFDCIGPPIGGTTVSFFEKSGLFRQGNYDLKVWPNVEADGINVPSLTPGKYKNPENSLRQKLVKLQSLHAKGQLQKLDWLDRVTMADVTRRIENEKIKSNMIFLNIEFPTPICKGKLHNIVYLEPDSPISNLQSQTFAYLDDPEIGKENLIETKHHKLNRAVRLGASDQDTKPTSLERNMLHNIIHLYPPTYVISSEEQDMVWKFRFYLKNQSKALSKFLKCISWEGGAEGEVMQALELLGQWSPMDVEDALELLTPTFHHVGVRNYGIKILDQATDDDLVLYLLQLVQALKYENFDRIFKAYAIIMPEKEILKSLDDKSCDQSFASASMDASDKSNSTTRNRPEETLIIDNSDSQSIMGSAKNEASPHASNFLKSYLEAESPNLATFLIRRACMNPKLANYLYWYLSIECEEQYSTREQNETVREMYNAVFKTFLKMLSTGTDELKKIYNNLKQQQTLVDSLVQIVKVVSKENNRKKRTEKFQQLLTDVETFKINFSNFEPRPLPLDPDIWVKGIIPEKVTLFKSALMPSKLTFITIDNQEYVAIFKHGDDLRQDQLILQMISLMDKLLRKENLDLKLTPYKVLACSSKHGLMQYIESTTVADVLAIEGSIHNFFRKHNPSDHGPYGIVPEVMDTYIRSCAGYCVITYLLGVGDRHLDNLLLTTSGKLFHIDFGYILGRDPKPLPPPMKLSKEMVDGMGGANSEFYNEFRKQCYTAFLHLRRHANVMLNLFSLMIDASVPDIALEPDKAVKKVEDNLKLQLTEEEAVQHLQNLIDISVSAVMPALVEQIHKFAQYWRK